MQDPGDTQFQPRSRAFIAFSLTLEYRALTAVGAQAKRRLAERLEDEEDAFSIRRNLLVLHHSQCLYH